MNEHIFIKWTAIGLVILHTGLWLWAFGGMMEWLLPNVPWPSYSNPELPEWLLFFHWTSVLFASTVFLYGYTNRWSRIPDFMAIGYGLMALVCLIETLGYMTNDTKFLAMALEYTAYILIVILLYRPAFRAYHF